MVQDEHNDQQDFRLASWSALTTQSGAPPPRWVSPDDLTLSWTTSATAVEVRLRLSPGWTLQGWTGPGCGSGSLWKMGTCDEWTSLTVDLGQDSNSNNNTFVEGFGHVQLPTVLQTCVAYTTIDTDNNQVVRRLRVASLALPLAHTAEALYDALDPEALAVVVSHKLASVDEEAAELGEQWLEALLQSVYRSAMEQDALEQQQREHGIEGKFLAQERLLDREGDLPVEQVLLGQGHVRLRPVPLMIYLLLQSDALRQSKLSDDRRHAALLEMTSMAPSVLTRYLAPRLQLWSVDEKEPIVDVLDLSAEAIQLAVLEYGDSPTPLILFLDSPSLILVLDARWINASVGGSQPALVSEALQTCIDEAAQSYRTPPKILYALDPNDNEQSSVLTLLQECLKEDLPSRSGHENFNEWKLDIAAAVEEYVDASALRARHSSLTHCATENSKRRNSWATRQASSQQCGCDDSRQPTWFHQTNHCGDRPQWRPEVAPCVPGACPERRRCRT